MKRRTARKILKRVGYHAMMVANCEVSLLRPNLYKRGTVSRAASTLGTWGLWDTDSSTWFGTKHGPFIFHDFDLARRERQIMAARIPCDPLRISVEPFTSATIKLDEIRPQNTLAQALDLIDKRGY